MGEETELSRLEAIDSGLIKALEKADSLCSLAQVVLEEYDGVDEELMLPSASRARQGAYRMMALAQGIYYTVAMVSYEERKHKCGT